MSILRLVSFMLVVALAVTSFPVTSFAQAIGDSSQNATVSNTSNDDDDNIFKWTGFAVFILVIGVLAWVGLRTDIERWRADEPSVELFETADADMTLFMDFAPLEQGLDTSLSDEPSAQVAGKVGVELRF